MQNQNVLPQALATALTPDWREEGKPPVFSFRPLVARSLERRTVFCVFSGQIGLADCERFQAALNDLCIEQTAKIILDLSGLALSKSAVGTLVVFAALTHGLNKRLYLYAASPQIKTMLRQMELGSFFNYLETEDDVIATIVI